MERRIDDRRGGRAGAATGEAAIAACGDMATAICTEALMIDYGGQRFAGERTMLWRFDEADGPTLLFPDGRLFVAMQFRQDGGHARALFSHKCGEDLYEGAAAIGDANSWRLVWSVSGPRKDYTLDTFYVRIGESEAAVNAREMEAGAEDFGAPPLSIAF